MYKAFCINDVDNKWPSSTKVLDATPTLQQFLDEHAVNRTLAALLSSDGTVSAADMQELWFPEIEADVFISHSRKDEKRAVSISSFLQREFGLNTFIDSQVWKHADALLREIDDTYCANDDNATYSYKRRNGTTSHVHMMLMVALMKMIDQTECILFANTPHSITPGAATAQTYSSWIYGELAMIESLRRRPKRDNISKSIKSLVVGESLEKTAEFRPFYSVNLSALPELSNVHLDQWAKAWRLLSARVPQTTSHPLDILYHLAGVERPRPGE